MRNQLLLLIVALFLLVGCDHGTKYWAHTSLKGAPSVELVEGVVDLRYAENDDMAFSLLRSVPAEKKRPWFLVIGIVGIAALAVTWSARRGASVAEQSAYVLMLAGALGNVADRFFRGYVVDFIHVHRWPIFNVADALLVAGMLLYLLVRYRDTPTTSGVPPASSLKA